MRAFSFVGSDGDMLRERMAGKLFIRTEERQKGGQLASSIRQLMTSHRPVLTPGTVRLMSRV